MAREGSWPYMGQSQVEPTPVGDDSPIEDGRAGPAASAGKAVEIPATKPAATITRLARIPTEKALP